MRVERASAKMERLTQSGLADMSNSEKEHSSEDESSDEEPRYPFKLGPNGWEICQPEEPKPVEPPAPIEPPKETKAEVAAAVEVKQTVVEEEEDEVSDVPTEEDEMAESWNAFHMRLQQQKKTGAALEPEETEDYGRDPSFTLRPATFSPAPEAARDDFYEELNLWYTQQFEARRVSAGP